MEYEHWKISEKDRIMTITLNRADLKNRLSAETLYELRKITLSLKQRPDIWAVILEGAGDNFSVGVDVKTIGSMIGQDKDVYREVLADLQACLDEFEALEKPVIAKVKGYCLGGGLILALCCDFRIASEDAVFGLPEIKRSIAVIMGTQRITRIAGIAAAKEMIYFAENFDSRKAMEYGLLHHVVPADKIDNFVDDFAKKFLKLPPLAVGISKRIIDRGYNLSLRESQDIEIEAQAELLNSADFREAVKSFFEKREPVYTGK